ncbi:hypothetical protein LBMAG53_29180 [Planctomycetota bacterium]|nr:hypothetical protein LBMAG53_29180 [Planctomycetota bacterium]
MNHFTRSLACGLCLAAVLAGEADNKPIEPKPVGPATYWYQVTVAQHVHEVGDYTYYGTSPLQLGAMANLLAEHKPLRLDNLVIFNDDGKAVPWSSDDPTIKGSVIIAGDRVIAILPLTGDPTVVKQDKVEKTEPATPVEARPSDPGKF